ncbi:MAG: C25 family cysteine peptidase, partial [Candidatus Eiseniibacteriota bacterium]
RAERIRFFIRDAYQNWGTLFVVLGGDTDQIPTRMIQSTLPVLEQIPSDMYFGCLDGNWNADADALLGEGISGSNPAPADDVDLLFEVSVGRISASTPEEASDYIDKLLAYAIDAPDDDGYPASVLALAERLFPETHGATYADEALALVPGLFTTTRLYEDAGSIPGASELTLDAAVDSINAGYGVLLHVGHGYRNTMSIGPDTIDNQTVDALVNGPRQPIVCSINCSSASIDYNTIGEHWILNPAGGAIAYVGTSRQSYLNPATTYMQEWFRLAFQDTVRSFGLVTDLARLALVTGADNDGARRRNLTATVALGDPELELRAARIDTLAVEHAASFELGQGTFPVEVRDEGAPLAGATVTLVAAGGAAYARGTTGAAGTVQLPFSPHAPGDATLTVWAPGHRVVRSMVPVVETPEPFAHAHGVLIDDDTSGLSSGDGDGLVDAGELVEVVIELANGGAAPLHALVATLTVDDPAGVLTLVEDVVDHGTLEPDSLSTGSSPFAILVDSAVPAAYQPLLQLAMVASEGAWNEVIPLPVRRPELEHEGHRVDDASPRGNGNGVIESGEEIWLFPAVRNAGLDDVDSVSVTLRALDLELEPHPLVAVTDSTVTLGGLAAGAVARGDSLVLSLDPAADPAGVLLELTLSAPPQSDRVRLVDIVPPGVADSLRATGSQRSITLGWHPAPDEDLEGYDIYRSDTPGGMETRINDQTILGSATYEDRGLPELTRFYYTVVARDSSRNRGPVSAIVSATTTPPLHAGWPQVVGIQSSASPTPIDLDGDGVLEILVAADMQHAWHASGEEVTDGDDDPRTSGPLSLAARSAERGFQATQAAGNLDTEPGIEIANVSFIADSLFVWSADGTPLSGFPKRLQSDYNWASPIMADLDVDRDREILVWTGDGRLYGWHHDGEEIVDGDQNPSTDGILIRIPDAEFCYGAPAVANLDGDPELEIVVAVNLSSDDAGRIYAVESDGTIVPGWPVATGGPLQPSAISSSPAIGDLDQDGDPEIVVTAERDGGRVVVLEADGSPVPGWPVPVPANTADARLPSPVLADLDDDGFLDVIVPSTDGNLHAWDRHGVPLDGFPVGFADLPAQATQCTPAVADVDADGKLEILLGDESGKLHGFNHDGSQIDGFPIQTGGELRGSPAVWDLDADGLVEIVAMSSDLNVYLWDLPHVFDPDAAPWPFFRHDVRNHGSTAAPRLPDAIRDPAAGATSPVVRPALHRAVPNPFNPATRIAFEVPGEPGSARPLTLAIYDVTGRRVRTLIDGAVGSGRHVAVWDGRTDRGPGAASGVYLVRLAMPGFTDSRKIVLLE